MTRFRSLHHAGRDHHDNATVLAFLNWAAEVRSFRPQILHRRFDVIAHNSDRVLPRVIISLAFPQAVRRVHARRSPSLLENLAVAKTPDADRVRGGSEGDQDGEHRE